MEISKYIKILALYKATISVAAPARSTQSSGYSQLVSTTNLTCKCCQLISGKITSFNLK